jgi:predicted Rossmann fold nucleotide-binding protein DprA/Smf involved in DNA uptake
LTTIPGLFLFAKGEGRTAAAGLHVVGSDSLLDQPLVGLFCSRKCPGTPIVLAYDLAIALREAGIATIGGFQTPVERDCLDFLLKGRQPVVICPARAPYREVPRALRMPVAEGRVAIVTPFADHEARQDRRLAERRNQFVASLATTVFVIHAAAGSATERLAGELLDAGRRVVTFSIPESEPLLAKGAVGIEPEILGDSQALRTILGCG